MSRSVTRRSSATGHPTRQQLDELDALLKRMLDLPVNHLEDEGDADAPAPPADAAPLPQASAPEPMRGPHRPTVARQPAEPPAVNYSTAEEEEADLKPRVVSDEPEAQAKGPAALPDKAGAERPEDWVPLTSAWQPSARTWKPLSEAWKQAQAGASPPAVEAEPALGSDPAPEPRAEAAPPISESAPALVPAEAAAPALRIAAAVPASAGGPRWLLWPLLGLNAAFDVCLIPFGPAGRWLRGRAGRMALGVVGLLALAAAAALAAADWFGWTG